MDVIVSWSKPQSKIVALKLKDWLPTVLPTIKAWMSEKSIEKGQPWFREVHNGLDKATSSIICVTAENAHSPWLYYEAGAVAAKGAESSICPYLIGVTPDAIANSPLSQYQCTLANQDDTWALIQSLNGRLTSPHNVDLLLVNFNLKWGELLESIESATSTPKISTVSRPENSELSETAKQLLAALAKSNDATLLRGRTSEGDSFQVGGINLCSDQSPRSIARWAEAVEELSRGRMLRARGTSGKVFELSDSGFARADALPIAANEESSATFHDRPSLQIVFDKSKHLARHQDGHVDFFVAVQNSGQTRTRLSAVRIESLESLDNVEQNSAYANQFHALPLRLVHAQLGQHLDQSDLVQVVVMNSKMGDDFFHFCGPDQEYNTPVGMYRLKIVASGRGAMPAHASFLLSTDTSGRLAVERLKS
ncbi:MAG: hypothetical protein AB7I37_19595 [Pirellulales bacterium]